MFARRKFVYLLFLCVLVFATCLSLPKTYAADELDEIWGGCKKPTCKKNGNCDGKVACPGNCTGADNGALCGKDLKSSPSGDVWKCGDPITDGGGCNLKGESGSTDAWQCKCEAEICKSKAISTTCTYYTECATD